MKQVLFKRLSIQNFLSVGEDTININFIQGINAIKGQNLDKKDGRNGVGKSTIADSIHFALFGTPIREIKSSQLIHYGSTDPSIVKLWFDIVDGNKTSAYELVRMAGPSKIFLSENDVDITKSTIPKTTEYIQNLLNITPEVFVNSILLSANLSTPFLSQKKTEKRKFLEGVLGLEVFGNMLLIARQNYNEVKNEYSIEYARLQDKNKSYKNLNDIYQSYNENKEQKRNNLLERIKGLENKISAIELENSKISQRLIECENNKQPIEVDTKIQKLEKAKEKLITRVAKLRANKHSLISKIENLNSQPKICQYCGSPLSNKKTDNKEDIIKTESEIAIIDENIQKTTDKTTEINLSIEKLRNKRDLILEENNKALYLNKTIQKNKNSIESMYSDIKNINHDIIGLDTQDKVYETQLSELKKEVDELSSRIEELDKKLDIYQVAKMIVSEEGIRSYIVTKVLKLLNSRLAFYLNRLDANCTCVFDKYFNENMTNSNGKECSYFNFSAGERKRIDLAMLFTFQDLRRLQAKCSLNLSIYDELLDSSLDEVGISKTLDILKDNSTKYNECVYIITHRKDAIFEITGEEINLEKRNGATRLVL